MIPLGFDQRQYVDLTSWDGRSVKVLQELFDGVHALLTRPFRQSRNAPTLADDSWVLARSMAAAGELQQLTEKIQTLGGVLIPGSGAVKDVLGALEEVHKTYDAVGAAIDRFVAPAVRASQMDLKAYTAIEGGSLVTAIANNRGHCSRIVQYYARAGGLREDLEPRLTPVKLAELDETFGRLGTADGDLFEALTSVGDVLTEEASVIVGLLLSKQVEEARKRVLEGRKKLVQLRQALTSSMAKLQKIEGSLGYVRRPGRKSSQ